MLRKRRFGNVAAAYGTYGNLVRDFFRGNTFTNWDASVIKDWKFTERSSGEFRLEIFNVLTTPISATRSLMAAAIPIHSAHRIRLAGRTHAGRGKQQPGTRERWSPRVPVGLQAKLSNSWCLFR